MKPLLPRDRVTSAVPSRPFARALAWAKESLLARALALVAGLFLLAFIGSSAAAARSTSVSDAPAPSSSVTTTSALLTIAAPDAGGAHALRPPEPAPRAAPEIPSDVIELDPPTAPARGRGDTPSTLPHATPDDPVELNTAGVEQLRRLPGIGAKRAEAVLSLRAKLPGGRFHHLEDLLKVKGVGRAMLKRWHPLVRIDGA